MATLKLVILEGADGLGKSTQANILAEKLGANLIRQPSPDNIVSFIRSEMKTNPAYTALERQLLGAISHTVDAFTKFQGEASIVMDRSWLSGIIYGKRTGVEPYEVELLSQILSKVYQYNTRGDTFDVHVIFMDGTKRLDQPDDDVFESGTNWGELTAEYNALYERLKNTEDFHVFSKTETVTRVTVDNKTVDQIATEIETVINGKTA